MIGLLLTYVGVVVMYFVARDKLDAIVWFTVGAATIGLVGWAAWQERRLLWFAANGKEVQAQVGQIGMLGKHGIRKITIHFSIDGVTHEVSFSGSVAEYPEGFKYPILVNPSNPKRFVAKHDVFPR